MLYLPRDLSHFVRMWWRNRRRQRVWGQRFETAVRDKTFTLPTAAVVQVLPTETCNLRCPMCNQWGENSYFLSGARKAQHMPMDSLTELIRGLDPRDSMLSIHGGEPLVYKHTRKLLELLSERPFDIMISTNGTLLKRYHEPLADIENLAFLLSIDGDETVHDSIRGQGSFKAAKDGLAALFELRRSRGKPLPLVIMNFVVCEYNTPQAIDEAREVARELGVVVLNYNMRWFLTEEVGEAYESHLKERFGLRSSGAWRGWISERPDHDYGPAAEMLRRVQRLGRLRLMPPWITVSPSQLRGRDFDEYYTDYGNVFGNESCFMPFYWARIHANGDLIYCPGHPDVIVGNVFRDGFTEAFNSQASIRFREYILGERFPICNRCCGLYMTNSGRPQEQKVRRRLGLPKQVQVNYP